MFLQAPGALGSDKAVPISVLITIAMLIGVFIPTPSACAQNVQDNFFPIALRTPGSYQMLVFRNPGSGNGEDLMLGVLDVPTYRQSLEQAMYPWYHDTYIPEVPGDYAWAIGADDSYHPFDADGDGTDEVLAHNGSTEIAVLDGVTGTLALKNTWTSSRVLEGPAGNWTLGWNGGTDSLTPMDLDGNGDDEVLIFGNYPSQDLTWMGVLDYRQNRMRLMYNAPRESIAGGAQRATIDGVPIGLDSSFQAMDLRGNGRDEIVARIPLGGGIFEVAVFRATRTELKMEAYSDGPNIEAIGDEPWFFGEGDPLMPIDVDGDGRDEMLSVSKSSQRLGFIRLRPSDSELVVFAQAETQGGSILVRGARGEDDLVVSLNSGIQFHPVDVDGNGVDEIAYFNPASTVQSFGILAFIQGELRHVWSTPQYNIPGPGGRIVELSWDSSIVGRNIDTSAREEVVIYDYGAGIPRMQVFRASASGMVCTMDESLGPINRWTMDSVYDAPAMPFPAWSNAEQIDAYQHISSRITGSTDDIREEYVLDTAIPETWLAILGSLPKPARIPQADWNAVRKQVGEEFQALASVINIFDRMQEIQEYTKDAMIADANHVDQKMRSAIAVPPAGTGIDMSPLAWASQFVGVAGGAVGSPATATVQFVLGIVDSLVQPPATAPLRPGDILADYKIMLQDDLVTVRQEIENRERVVRGDWGKLATFGTRYPGVEIGNLPGRSTSHTRELYRTLFLELWTVNHSSGFLKGSAWDPTRFTPLYLTYDFNRSDPYAVRVGMVRKPAYAEQIGFPSEAVFNELGPPNIVSFLWGDAPWYWEGARYPASRP